eukprot:CAMPEP_0206225062 /NCGR_PEP_ID=MMETSP0047_2-20121206/7354_1 /ASSEMBLY_ACC=CAM_ASM_000192 /TAXON_ID=195065 /ORGANISM="Chroomonas mesostigmatica_cf, Strain CCMP1168" /LENGTH=151 /DNA_ID=CAMNT_0053648051 /DNA_START=101 /DNA_END=553 /DNA_ORIENTATION=-
MSELGKRAPDGAVKRPGAPAAPGRSPTAPTGVMAVVVGAVGSSQVKQPPSDAKRAQEKQRQRVGYQQAVDKHKGAHFVIADNTFCDNVQLVPVLPSAAREAASVDSVQFAAHVLHVRLRAREAASVDSVQFAAHVLHVRLRAREAASVDSV